MTRPCPRVRSSSGRSGATSGTRVTSTGDPSTRQRRDRQVGGVGGREHREDPAQAPADHVHRPAAGVLRHLAHRGRDHLLHPVLEPEVAVAEGDGAVLHEVRRPPGLDEVLDEGAAAAQVEADRRRRQRRHQQHRVALAARPPAPDGSGRPRAACCRRSGSAASGAGRRARRTAAGARRCRLPTPPGPASARGPCRETTPSRAGRTDLSCTGWAAVSSSRNESAHAATSCSITCLRIAFIRRVTSRPSA